MLLLHESFIKLGVGESDAGRSDLSDGPGLDHGQDLASQIATPRSQLVGDLFPTQSAKASGDGHQLSRRFQR